MSPPSALTLRVLGGRRDPAASGGLPASSRPPPQPEGLPGELWCRGFHRSVDVPPPRPRGERDPVGGGHAAPPGRRKERAPPGLAAVGGASARRKGGRGPVRGLRLQGRKPGRTAGFRILLTGCLLPRRQEIIAWTLLGSNPTAGCHFLPLLPPPIIRLCI